MTFMTLYVMCVALGGVLMGTSIFLGGDADHDADFDADVDVDADFDADVDADFDAEGHAGFDAGHGLDVQHATGGLELSVLPFGSLRFWTFLVESFGLTGALLSCAGIPSGATLGISLAAGTAMGWAAFLFFRWLAKEEVSGAVALKSFKNEEARVLVRIPVGGLGKIALEQAAGRVEVLARTMDGEEIPRGAQVLVIGVKNGEAQVTALTPATRAATESSQAATARPVSEKNL